MNYRIMGRFMSLIVLTEAIFMLPAWAISVLYGEFESARAFAVAIAATVIVSVLVYVCCTSARIRFYAREGLVCVGLGWLIMSFVGCLPFMISGEIPEFIDAYFETVYRCVF